MAQDREITITVFDDDASTTVDLNGFHGTGCADVLKAFKELGKTRVDKKKPEYMKRTNSVLTNAARR
jgi:hypothetical protein